MGRCFKCQSNSRPFEERGRGCPHHPAARQEGVPDFHCGERRRGWPRPEQGATEAAAGCLQGRWQDDHATGAAAKVEEAARHQGEGREADQVRDTVHLTDILPCDKCSSFKKANKFLLRNVFFQSCLSSVEVGIKNLSNREKNLALLEYGAIMESNKEQNNCIEVVAMKHPIQESRPFNVLAFFYFQDLFRQEASARQQAVNRQDNALTSRVTQAGRLQEKKSPENPHVPTHTTTATSKKSICYFSRSPQKRRKRKFRGRKLTC